MNSSKYIIYMNNVDVDFNDKNSIEIYFKNIFIRLKDKLELGYYTVNVYKDNSIILELEYEEDSYYDEFDLKIIVEETIFLYQMEDIFIDKNIINKSKIIKYNNKLYLYPSKLSDIELGYLYEISKLIYKNTENIIKYGREIPLNLI